VPGAGAGGGTARISEALTRLEGLSGSPVSEHVEVYEDVHGRLLAELAHLDGA
jgi:hypothetical protein